MNLVGYQRFRSFLKGSVLLCMLLAGGFFISPVSSAETIGQSITFYVNKNFDQYSRTSLPATLRHMGNKILVYVDDLYWDRLSAYQQSVLMQKVMDLAADFDNHIYPVETNFWGSEPTPGIDGDPRVTILLEALQTGNGGYFDNIHNYASDPGRNSNQREMIMLNADALTGSFIDVFLGHEFQHLISSYQKDILRNVSEEVWLNEIRSEYTASLLNQNIPFTNSSLYRRVQTFLHTPSDSLTEWLNVPTDYGIAAVFAEYITGRYGTSILSETLRDSSLGVVSINQYLARKGLREQFSDVFLDWMVASYLNDTKDSRYSYLKSELQGIRVSPVSRLVLSSGGTSAGVSLKYWQPVWQEVLITDASNAGLKIDINGTSSDIPIAQLILYYSDGSYEVRRADPIAGSRTVYIPLVSSGKQLVRVVVASTYTARTSGDTLSMTVSVNYVDASALQAGLALPTPSPSPVPVAMGAVQEGALVKRNNSEPEVYVVRGLYKRYLRPEIIALYGHLISAVVRALDSGTFDIYRISNYVRAINDQKVYAVWPDGTKHWLRMSAQHFTDSGRDWESIFIINEAELNSYKTGPDITQ